MTGQSRFATLLGLIFAVSMTTIDQTIVALAAPTIQQDLGLTGEAIRWAVNSYLLAAAALFIVGGRLSDLYGHRRLALIGIAAFAGTSFLCGIAPAGNSAEVWLITTRAMQGASAAIMVPAAVGIVVQSFEVARRGRAMAIFFAVTGAMTAIGPIAGGYLTEWTWRAIFLVNIPIAFVGFVLVATSAAKSDRTSGRIDLAGGLLISVGMLLLVLGLQQVPDLGWDSPLLWGVLLAGVAAVVGFAWYERFPRDPLVRLAAFRSPAFTIAVLSTLIASVAFVPTFYFLSVYGQVSLRQTALQTGLLFLKFFLGFVIASRFGSVLFDRRGARRVLIVGGVLGAVGYGLLAARAPQLAFDATAFFNAQTAPLALAGAGIGFMYSPMSTDAVNRAVGASYGEVTALSQSARSFGGALGLALLGSVVAGSFKDSLVTSFDRLGLPAGAAQTAADSVSGSNESAQLATLPAGLAKSILASVAQDYASAVSPVFIGMTIAMVLVALLGLVYPRTDSRATVGRRILESETSREDTRP